MVPVRIVKPPVKLKERAICPVPGKTDGRDWRRVRGERGGTFSDEKGN
jgi:hypothetical protein